MVFNGNGALLIFFAIGLIWILVLTVIVFRMVRHYNTLTRGITKTGLRDVLESILAKEEDVQKKEMELREGISRIEGEGKLHFQRLGIVRFNPFSDTGGSQSFSMALLDAKDNGIVITSLYARTGNRWYVKEIKEGKGKELALSKEEESAIKKTHL